MPSKWYGQSNSFNVFGQYESSLAAHIQTSIIVKDDLTDTMLNYYKNSYYTRVQKLLTKAKRNYVNGIPVAENYYGDRKILSVLKAGIISQVERKFGEKITLVSVNKTENNVYFSVYKYLFDVRGMTSPAYKIITVAPVGIPLEGAPSGFGQPDKLYFDRYEQMPSSNSVVLYYRIGAGVFTEYSETVIMPVFDNTVYYAEYRFNSAPKSSDPNAHIKYCIYTDEDFYGADLYTLHDRDDDDYYPVMPLVRSMDAPGLVEIAQTEALIETLGISPKPFIEDIRNEHRDFLLDGEASVHLMLGFDPCIGLTDFTLIDKPAPTAEEIQGTLRYAVEFFSEYVGKPKYARIVWNQPSFEISLLFNEVYVTNVASTDRSIGECWCVSSNMKDGEYYLEGGGENYSYVPTEAISTIYYFQQITATTAKRVEVTNLTVDTYIPRETSRKLEVQNQTRAVRAFIPMNHRIVRKVPRRLRDALLNRSVTVLSNSCINQEYEWYQTEEFALVVQIIAIVLTIISLGKTYKLLVLAASIGATTFVRVLLYRYIMALLFKAVAQALVKLVGIEGAYIFAILAMAYGKFGNLGTWEANALIDTGSTIWGAVNDTVEDKMRKLSDDAAKVQDEMKVLMAELAEVSDSLDNSDSINPLAFQRNVWNNGNNFSLEIDDYYSLAYDLNKGNRLFELPKIYYPYMLRLPSIYDTLSGMDK
jgi:hypothetical protein